MNGHVIKFQSPASPSVRNLCRAAIQTHYNKEPHSPGCKRFLGFWSKLIAIKKEIIAFGSKLKHARKRNRKALLLQKIEHLEAQRTRYERKIHRINNRIEWTRANIAVNQPHG